MKNTNYERGQIYLRMSYFNFNGKICKEETPIIGPSNRGLRYGDGLFETMKYEEGAIFFEDEHFARLWKGMLFLQFDIPKNFTPLLLLQQIKALIKKNGLSGMVRIRLQVFRGSGGLYDAKNNLPNYIIQVWQLPNQHINSNGLVIGIYKETRKTCDTISNLKHSNYLPYVLAALQAKKEKWNDAIVLNEKYRVCDTTMANIFLIKEDIIYTPSLQEGCVAGIMRKNILQQLALNGWQIKETAITEEEIKNADEVFLSNAIYNIRWVKQIEEVQYQNTNFQKIYGQLFGG